jgi:glycosyltransferase involved in cell wall biosynthesis
MKVLAAHNYYQQAGGEDGVFHDETALLESHGDEVIRYSVRNDELREEGILRRAALAAGTVWNRQSYAGIRRLIRRERPDVMHVHNTLPLLSPAIYRAARAEGVAVVHTLHNYRILCSGALLFRDGHVCEECVGARFAVHGIRHRCYRNSAGASAAVALTTGIHWGLKTWTDTVNRYISMTDFGKSRFVAGGLPEEKIAVKPHFVRNAPPRGNGNGSYFLYVGRLTADKGINVLLAAWRLQRSGLRLKIVGDGPERENVQTAAAEMAGVDVLGRMGAADVFELMQGARAVVVPSLWYETFGRVVTEAFACGTPVIVSDIGALAELVQDGRTGFRFTAGNPDQLAGVMNRFGADAAWERPLRDAAYAQYVERYTPDRNYVELMSIYRDAMRDAAGDNASNGSDIDKPAKTDDAVSPGNRFGGT